MELSISILSIKNNLEKNIKLLDKNKFNYFHIDIMDGKFVSNTTWNADKLEKISFSHPLDVHLMVKDVDKYCEEFSKLKPKIITFHYEAVEDHKKYIDKIHSYGIKAGIAINPDTDVDLIIPLLKYVDLVLVMSVYPGYGGQTFIKDVTKKISKLKELQKEYNYVIEIDGGVNDETIKYCDCNIVVVGSFITNGNYEKQIEKLKI